MLIAEEEPIPSTLQSVDMFNNEGEPIASALKTVDMLVSVEEPVLSTLKTVDMLTTEVEPITSTLQTVDMLKIEDEPMPSTLQIVDILRIEIEPITSISETVENILKTEDKTFSYASQCDKLRTEGESNPSTSQTVDTLGIEVEPIPCTSQTVQKNIQTQDKTISSPSQTVDMLRTEDEPIIFTSQAVDILEIEDQPTSSVSQITSNLETEYESTNSTSAMCHLENVNQSSPTSNNISENPFDGWTKDEKYQLYFGVKYKGSRRVKEIQETLPNKTVDQIVAVIDHLKTKANNNPECTLRKLKVRKVKTKPLIPLATWAKVLTDNRSFNELQNECANTVRLIADLEKIPAPAHTDMIDFRKIYHQIADAMEGKTVSNDISVSEILKSCVLDAALVSRPFIKPGAFKHVINSVNFKEKEQPFFPRPTQDNELAIIRHFCALRNYNPLGIPEETLTPAANVPKQE